ncbi:MAG: DUF1697 domain-containing protein [Polyangiaceae bacterium]
MAVSREPESTFVAMLRGVNVGGKHVLPMRDLVTMFHDAGCSHASAYIQSGNVVFRARASVASRVPDAVQRAIHARYKFGARPVVRTAEDLQRIAGDNPYLTWDRDGRTLHVAFLADAPTMDRVAALDRHRSPPDEFVVLGSEVYLRCPNGMAHSKLTNQYFDATLSTTSTVRNWRTVLKLAELAERARAAG